MRQPIILQNRQQHIRIEGKMGGDMKETTEQR